MTHGSLFSGIGGFDLAARWMGWENVFHVEQDEFCRQVLAHHFPNSKPFTDVRQFPATDFCGRVRILSGGFPCQPFSAAGKRLGSDDPRHLWPAMLDAIQSIRPGWVLAENVRGFVNWQSGLLFDQVCLDLENEGYEVFPVILGAASVNAPHKRDRIWIIGYNATHANSQERKRGSRASQREREAGEQRGDRVQRATARSGKVGPTAYANANGLQGGLSADKHKETPGAGAYAAQRIPIQPKGLQFKNFPTFAPVCGSDDGFSRRLDNITFSKWRKESIKAYGNAIVPQVAYEIFKAIEEYEFSR